MGWNGLEWVGNGEKRREISAHNIGIKIEPDIRWNRQSGFRFNPNICGPAIYNIKKDLKTMARTVEMSAHNIGIKIEPYIRWNRQSGFRFNPNICGPAIYNIKKDLKTGRPR